jgi:hypothetical protein
MNKKKLIFQITFAFLLCVIIESISWVILSKQHQQVKFLINLHYGQTVKGAKELGFNEIDPLCGWALSKAKLQSMGYVTEKNCVVLKSRGDFPIPALKILITGGSTSDIATHPTNWPQKLHDLFLKNHINATIYVGAIAGYSSGQELLKLIRDGISLKPDIHLSYSGVNDADDGGYISNYEQDFYKTAYRQSVTGTILPNTMLLVKKIFQLGYYGLSIQVNEPIQAFDFWKQNMAAMDGIAWKNGYKFIGILQPVLGGGNYLDQKLEENYKWRVKLYEGYFSKARKYVPCDSSLYDFTNIFDTAKGKVYVDDCHLTDPYQIVLATNIFNLLSDGGYLSKKQK